MGARILVCDDDPSYSKMVEDALVPEGYEVFLTPDTEQFISWVGAYSAPDLFIIDFQMGGGGGPAAVRTLKASPATNRVPILICSGMPLDQQRKWFADQPGLSFIKKPFKLAELEALVKSLLAGRQS